MISTDVSGSGYCNYYHDKSRYETPGGKPKTAWYDNEVPTNEIGRNNVRPSRDYEGADVCRSVAKKLARVAEANRTSTAQQMRSRMQSGGNIQPREPIKTIRMSNALLWREQRST